MDRRAELQRIRQHLAQVDDPVALLEGIFAYAPVGLQIYKASGQCLLVNQTFIEMFGAAPPPDYNVLRDEIAEASGVLPLIRKAFTGEVVEVPPLWYDPRDLKQVDVPEGRRVAIGSTFFPLYDREGNLSHVAIVFRDLTNEMRAREELQAHRDLLESVIRQMPAGVFLVDARSQVLLSNAQVKAVLGSEEVPPRWLDQDGPLGRALARGESTSGEIVHHDRAGLKVVLRVDASPVKDRGGAIVAAVLAVHDVTEQHRNAEAETLLARAGEMLASSLDWEATLDAVTRLLVPGRADWCAVDLVPEGGGPYEQVAIAHVDPARVELARELRRRWPPDPDAPQGVGSVLKTGKPVLFREIPDALLVASARDPEHLRVMRELGLRSAMIVPLTARGRNLGALSLVSEHRSFDDEDLALAQELARRAAVAVDNARLYREAQEAAQAREAFLSIASHELRTPLTALQLQVQNLARQTRARDGGAGADRVSAATAKIDTQVQRLTKMVDDLLEVSRIVAGRMSFTLARVDLTSLAQEVAGRFADEAARAGSAIRVRGQAVVGDWDRARLDQVATNLISNAIKYGQGKPIEVLVEAQGDRARLTVVDHGIGIASADQDRIFGRFERAAEGLKYAGTGLGLWIVRQIVEAMGGTILVHSEEGKGSTFIVEVPIGPPVRRRTLAPPPS